MVYIEKERQTSTYTDIQTDRETELFNSIVKCAHHSHIAAFGIKRLLDVLLVRDRHLQLTGGRVGVRQQYGHGSQHR